MKNTGKRPIWGYCIVLVGAIAAPLLPFVILVFVPVLAVLCGAPIAGLLFAMLIDSFLLPEGLVPLYVSSTLYTVLFLPVYRYLRYTAL